MDFLGFVFGLFLLFYVILTANFGLESVFI